MASSSKTGAPPTALVVAVEALQQVAAMNEDACPGCQDARAAMSRRRAPPSSAGQESARAHRPGCAGAVAWPALEGILRG